MNAVIDTALSHNRVVTILLLLVLATGVLAYSRISKESAPDVPIPIIYISVIYEGISPEDAERLLVRPLERELQSIEGVDEMRAVAADGCASVTLEFDADFDPDQAELDVWQAVDTARPNCPPTSRNRSSRRSMSRFSCADGHFLWSGRGHSRRLPRSFWS